MGCDRCFVVVILLLLSCIIGTIRSQLVLIKEGFSSLIPEHLLFFNHEELKAILNGGKTIIVERLRSKTVYIDYRDTESTILTLWNVLSSLSEVALNFFSIM